MKTMHLLPATLLAGVALLLSAPAWAQDAAGPCDQSTQSDCVNWEDGVAYALGSGAPARWADTAAQKNLSAQRAARVDAARNLLELVKGINVTSQTTMRQAMLENDQVNTQIQGRIAGLRMVGEPRYFSDGSVQVKMAARLYELVPQEVYAPGAPRQIPGPTRQVPGTTRSGINTERSYSGLVIDARGTGVMPALSPKVLDPEGREVYGSSYVGREYAIEQGIVGYAKELEAARNNDRVQDNPLVIEAREAVGNNKADLVIDQEAADALRKIAQNQNFLRQSRVMIVLE